MGAVGHRGRKETWFVAAAALLLVWCLNAFWGVVLESQGEPVVGVENGCVVVYKEAIELQGPPGFATDFGCPPAPSNTSSWNGFVINVFEVKGLPTLASRFGFILPGTREWIYKSRAGSWYYVIIYNVPLWPLLAAALLMVWCAARVLRKHRKTHMLCNSCSYNLTGNLSCICPECGTPIDDGEK